jgi:hypothetical protein
MQVFCKMISGEAQSHLVRRASTRSLLGTLNHGEVRGGTRGSKRGGADQENRGWML